MYRQDIYMHYTLLHMSALAVGQDNYRETSLVWSLVADE